MLLRGGDLHLWWIEAHVVNSPAAWVDPAVVQAVLEGLVGDVEADDQVELEQAAQLLRLGQCARETWPTPRHLVNTLSRSNLLF